MKDNIEKIAEDFYNSHEVPKLIEDRPWIFASDFALFYHEQELERKNQLIKAQNDYINFLSEHLSSTSTFCAVHGQGASEEDIKEGKRLRNIISNLTKTP